MKKKLSSFFALIIFMAVAFSQSIVVSFAMGKNMMIMDHGIRDDRVMDCCDGEEYKQEHEEQWWCNHSCCIDSKTVKQNFIINNFSPNSKELKIKIIPVVDILSIYYDLSPSRNLVRKTSPPFFAKKIKNYSYKDFTKIIKSNT